MKLHRRYPRPLRIKTGLHRQYLQPQLVKLTPSYHDLELQRIKKRLRRQYMHLPQMRLRLQAVGRVPLLSFAGGTTGVPEAWVARSSDASR
jgi:hypothetical protein